MQPGQQAIGTSRLEDPPRLVGAEYALFAEHVREPGPAVRGDPGELLIEHVPNVGIDAVGPRPVFSGHSVGTEPRRHDVDRALATEPIGDLDEAELGLEVEAVPGFRLDGRYAMGQLLAEPGPAGGQQVGLGRGARRSDRREDPAACREDVEVRRAFLTEDELVLAGTREQQVRVRVDETRSDRPAGGIDPGEPCERQAVSFELRLDSSSLTDARDAALPNRDDG